MVQGIDSRLSRLQESELRCSVLGEPPCFRSVRRNERCLGLDMAPSGDMSQLVASQQDPLRNLFPPPGKENSLSFTRLGAAFLFSAMRGGGVGGFKYVQK